MKSKYSRITALLLALFLALFPLVSCSHAHESKNDSESYSNSLEEPSVPTEAAADAGAENIPTDTPAASDTTDVSDTTDTTDTTETGEQPQADPFADYDFGGKSVTLILPSSASTEFCGNATGSAFSAAVAKRNTGVEKRINISLLTQVRSSDTVAGYAQYLRNAAQAGAAGDSVWVIPNQLSSLATEGIFSNLAAGLNLSNPWYDTAFLSAATIGGYVPFVVGDMNPSAWENAPVVFADADLPAEVSANALYELVRTGEWTLAEMQFQAEVMKKLYNKNGIALNQAATRAMLYGTGFRLTTRDDNGTLLLDSLTEPAVNAYGSLLSLLQDPQLTVAGTVDETGTLFREGNALFLVDRLGRARELSPEDPARKLIYLPLPKTDSRQSSYFTTPLSYSMLAIPKADSNPVVGLITLAALGYESTQTLPVEFLQTYAFGYGDPRGTYQYTLEMLACILTGIGFEPETVYAPLLDQPWLTLSSALLSRQESVMLIYHQYREAWTNRLKALQEKLGSA